MTENVTAISIGGLGQGDYFLPGNPFYLRLRPFSSSIDVCSSYRKLLLLFSPFDTFFSSPEISPSAAAAESEKIKFISGEPVSTSFFLRSLITEKMGRPEEERSAAFRWKEDGRKELARRSPGQPRPGYTSTPRRKGIRVGCVGLFETGYVI